MDGHFGVLQERRKAEAVVGHGAVGHERKGRGREVEHQQEEALDGGQNHPGQGVELHVALVREPQNQAVDAQQPGPEHERALLAGPDGSEFVDSGQRAVGVLGDVGDGKVVGQRAPDQRRRRRRYGHKAGDASPPRRGRQTLRIDGRAACRGFKPDRGRAGQQVVNGQRQCDEERETAECRHENSRMIFARGPGAGCHAAAAACSS